MRDSPGTRTFPRPSRALVGLLVAASVASGSVVLPAAGDAEAKKRAKTPTLTLKSNLSKRLRRAQASQRSTFGLVSVCTDPAAADGCDRRAFPVRTKLVSMTADVLAGDAMPAAPSDPPEPPSQVSPAVQAAV
jgi:hypothetical protein